MWAARPGVEHPIKKGQMCSFLSFPSDRGKYWDKRFREIESEQKREGRTWERDKK